MSSSLSQDPDINVFSSRSETLRTSEQRRLFQGQKRRRNEKNRKAGQRPDPSWESQQICLEIRKDDLDKLSSRLASLEDPSVFIHELDFRSAAYGSTALTLAIERGRLEIIKTLLEHSPPLTFHYAIENDYKINSQNTSEKGKSLNWCSSYRPLDSSSLALSRILYTHGHYNYDHRHEGYNHSYGEEIFLMLVDGGLDLQGAYRCDIGRSLWFWAARKGHTRALQAFVACGFPVNLRASKTGYFHQRTNQVAPLHTTALWNSAHKGRLASVRFLLECGPVVDIPELQNPVKELIERDAHNFPTSQGNILNRRGGHNRQEVAPQENKPVKTNSPYSDEEHKGSASEADSEADVRPATHKTSQTYDEAMITMSPLMAASQGLYLVDSEFKRWSGNGERSSRPPADVGAFCEIIGLLLQSGANPNPIPKFTYPEWEFSGDPPRFPILLQVTELGVLPAIEVLLKHGADISARGGRGKSLLHMAVRSAQLVVVETVLEIGISVDMQDFKGFTAVHECILRGTDKILECLLKHKASVDHISKKGIFPLLLAVRQRKVQMVQMLLEHGANPNHMYASSSLAPWQLSSRQLGRIMGLGGNASSFEGTPLLAAVGPVEWHDFMKDKTGRSDGESEMAPENSGISKDPEVQRSLERSRETEESMRSYTVRQKDKRKDSAILKLQLCSLLLKFGADPLLEGLLGFQSEINQSRIAKKNLGDSSRHAPMYWRIEYYDPLTAAVLAVCGGYHFNSETPQAEVDIIRALTRAAGSNLTNIVLNNALRAMSWMEIPMSFDAPWPYWDVLGEGLPCQILAGLLELGANPNVRNEQGFGLLHKASLNLFSRKDQTDIIKLLVRYGADIGLLDSIGRTPLHLAAMSCPSTVATLLDLGADLTWKDKEKRTALHYACGGPKGWRSDIVPILSNALRGLRLYGFQDVIHLACTNEDTSIAEMLLPLADHGPWRNSFLQTLDENGDSPIHIACKAQSLKPLQIISTHLCNGICLRKQDRNGRTPLALAAFLNARVKVALLLRWIASNTTPSYERNVNGKFPQARFTIVARGTSTSHEIEVGNDEDRRECFRGRWWRGEGSLEDDPTLPFTAQEVVLPENKVDIGVTAGTRVNLTNSYDRKSKISRTEDGEQEKNSANLESSTNFDSYRPMARREQPFYTLSPIDRAMCLNMRDFSNRTALHYAAEQGNEEMLADLIAEPDIDLGPVTGCCDPSPLDLAKKNGNPFCVNILKEALEMREDRRKKMDWERGKGSRSENKKVIWRKCGVEEWKWIALRAFVSIFVMVIWMRTRY